MENLCLALYSFSCCEWSVGAGAMLAPDVWMETGQVSDMIWLRFIINLIIEKEFNDYIY